MSTNDIEMKENTNKTPESTFYAKFRSNPKEIKLGTALQGNIDLKGSFTRKNIESMVIKSSQYKGPKKLEIIFQNKLFVDQNQPLFEFINLNNIQTDEIVCDVYICFQLEEPKLIDSKKQDEWIRKIKTFDNEAQFCIVGLFNSEISVYDLNSKNKVENQRKKHKIEEEEDTSDYTLLNSLAITNSKKEDTVYCGLAALAKRDSLNSIEFTEICISHENKNSTYMVNLPSSLVGPKNQNIEVLETNPFDNRLLIAGTSSGHIQLYRIDNYDFSYAINSLGSEAPIKRKAKNSGKQTLNPIQEMKDIEPSGLTDLNWIDSSLIVSSSNESLKIINSYSFSLIDQISMNHHTATSVKSLNKDGVLMTSHDNGSVKIWDIKSKNRLVESISKAHRGLVSEVSVYPDNSNYIISSGYDGEVKIWDRRETSKAMYILPSQIKDKIFALCALNKSDKKLLISGGASAVLDFYDI